VKAAAADPLRVSEDEGRRAIVARTAPNIPPIAKQAHLSGRVVVDMTVSEDGNVEKVDVVSGNPILGGACVSAAKKWTFQPFKTEGKPCKAIVRASFEFGA
jgi:TonB family protein